MLKYVSISNAGTRTYNEDCIKISSIENKVCFILCDGLGGHECGDVAADIVANTFIKEFCYSENLSDFLLTTFIKAEKNVESHQRLTNNNMKTTAVCLIADDEKIYTAHVGDSRLYFFKKDGTYKRTLDHSIPQILVQSNTITEEEIRNHPNRNMLLKVMGDKWDEPLCEIAEPQTLNEFSAFLLCSDGFWELINEKEMISTLKDSADVQEWLNKMTTIVEQNGIGKDMDNFSAIAVFCE